MAQFAPPTCFFPAFICCMHYSTKAMNRVKGPVHRKSLCKRSLFFKINEERGDGCACFAAVLVAARRQHKHGKTTRLGSCYASDARAPSPAAARHRQVFCCNQRYPSIMSNWKLRKPRSDSQEKTWRLEPRVRWRLRFQSGRGTES